jgi:Toprim domain
MDLASAARALGGNVYRGRVLCPGPGHASKDDRSLCVWLDGDSFRVHSFANDDWARCKDYVRERLNLPHDFSPARDMPICRNQDKDTEMLGAACRLWRCSTADTALVSTYLREARGYDGPLPPSIRFLPPERYPQPAMIAAFGLGEVRGIHLTFLKEDGSGKADIDRPKIMMGPSRGWPIVIAEPNDLLGLAITEGIEDAISVHAATGLGVWAAGSCTRMPRLADVIPECVEAVTILGDFDDNGAGQKASKEFARALWERNCGFEIFAEQGIYNNEEEPRLE